MNQPSDEDNSPQTERLSGLQVLTTMLALQDAPSRADLLAKFNGNNRLLDDVLKLMIQESPKLGRDYAKAASQDKLPEARRAIHTFKSNCRQMGLPAIAQYAESLEQLAREGNLAEINAHSGNVQQLASAVADWAESLLTKN